MPPEDCGCFAIIRAPSTKSPPVDELVAIVLFVAARGMFDVPPAVSQVTFVN